MTRKSTALYIHGPYVDGLMLVARMLGAAGFELIMVDHNEDISERPETPPPLNLIVFDSNLVNLEGERLAERYYAQIKANPNTSQVPLVIISSENEKNLLDKLLADVHITKPIDPDRFGEILRGYLAK